MESAEQRHCSTFTSTIYSPSLNLNTTNFKTKTILHSAYRVHVVCLSEQTAIIPHKIWLVFITGTKCVYCAVRTESLNTIHVYFGLFKVLRDKNLPKQNKQQRLNVSSCVLARTLGLASHPNKCTSDSTNKSHLILYSYWISHHRRNIPYILESNPHPFYSFRGIKNQMGIRFVVESWILEKW